MFVRMAVNLILISMMSILWTASAEELQPPDWPVDTVIDTNMDADPVVPVRLGSFVVTLEKTTLEEVIAAAGAGNINERGDASEALSWICYCVSGPISYRLWLTSNEIGGGSVNNGMIAVKNESSGQVNKGCPELPSALLPVRMSNGIWIGSQEQSIRRKVGDQKVKSSFLIYDYIGKRDNFDVGGFVLIRLKNGQAEAIYMTHITTN